jgi:hypothetical protein
MTEARNDLFEDGVILEDFDIEELEEVIAPARLATD